MKKAFRTGFMFGLGYLLAENLYDSFNLALKVLDKKYNYSDELRRVLGLPEKKSPTIHKRVTNKIGFAIE